jgi:6-phosphogluconolactonase
MTRVVFRELSDADAVAKFAASELSVKLARLLESKPSVNLVLTGGSVGTRTLEELALLLAGVDLTNLQIWWTDERFIDRKSLDRNYVQAREALLSKIAIPQENVHEMPSLEDGDLAEVCAKFADLLTEDEPEFDIVLLGMGPDGHVASLFPNSKPDTFGTWIVAESNSPKPPKVRISLSYQALCSAAEVWFLVAGIDKADAVSQVFAGVQIPAGLVFGQKVTNWYLDKAASSGLTS